MPIVIITGWLMLFQEISPQRFLEWQGFIPTQFFYNFRLFLVFVHAGHVYLRDYRRTVGELFKSMINGWHLGEDDDQHSEDVVINPKFGQRRILPIIFIIL
jgi:thiosulfate reductase cytochrome b subunit